MNNKVYSLELYDINHSALISIHLNTQTCRIGPFYQECDREESIKLAMFMSLSFNGDKIPKVLVEVDRVASPFSAQSWAQKSYAASVARALEAYFVYNKISSTFPCS